MSWDYSAELQTIIFRFIAAAARQEFCIIAVDDVLRWNARHKESPDTRKGAKLIMLDAACYLTWSTQQRE